jgi:hypothetical protein
MTSERTDKICSDPVDADRQVELSVIDLARAIARALAREHHEKEERRRANPRPDAARNRPSTQ